MDLQRRIQVKLGVGIIQVLQLDDAGVLDAYKDPVDKTTLLISSADRRHIYVAGTRYSLDMFAADCDKWVASDPPHVPVWYRNSCVTSAKKIREMLAKVDAVMRL